MTDVFISYKREEREAVQIIADKLAALEVEVWFDVGLKSEGSFDSQIADQLSAAKAVLVCWTPGAIASEWVRAEAAQAREADKYVACFLEPTSLIAPFNLVQTEDLSA
jgi:adenylate cyclase